MKPFRRKELVLSLIKDDLVNQKLVNQLNALDLDAGQYYLHLGSTIFRLMGIPDSPETEPLYDLYLRLGKQVQCMDLREPQGLETLAETIYAELRKWK